MKIVATPIECICIFDAKGIPKPIRFKVIENDESRVINVDTIVAKDKMKVAGNPIWLFVCQSEIDGVLKQYELKYELNTCKWLLWKI